MPVPRYWIVAVSSCVCAVACAPPSTVQTPPAWPQGEDNAAKGAAIPTLAPSTRSGLTREEQTTRLNAAPSYQGGPLVTVAAGAYWTGCDVDKDPYCRREDGAFRQVELGSYQIDKFEVTVANYAECVEAGGCSAKGLEGYDDGTRQIDWKNCNWGRAGKENHPLNCVSWKKADNYCKWAGKRLPSEAEWEKAARGTDKRTYPWGNEMITCEYAVTNQTGQDPDKGCGLNSTMPVGSKPKGASPYGVQDIVGNVWEWTADEYAPAKGAPALPPSDDTHHVGKGGCWGSGNPWNSRISWSHHYQASYGSNVRLGFRCAADVAATDTKLASAPAE